MRLGAGGGGGVSGVRTGKHSFRASSRSWRQTHKVTLSQALVPRALHCVYIGRSWAWPPSKSAPFEASPPDASPPDVKGTCRALIAHLKVDMLSKDLQQMPTMGMEFSTGKQSFQTSSRSWRRMHKGILSQALAKSIVVQFVHPKIGHGEEIFAADTHLKLNLLGGELQPGKRWLQSRIAAAKQGGCQPPQVRLIRDRDIRLQQRPDWFVIGVDHLEQGVVAVRRAAHSDVIGSISR